MIRSLWLLSVGAAVTGFYSLRVNMNAWLDRPDRACWCDHLSRRWTRLILKLAGVRVLVIDADRADWSKPCVVVANHQSWFDVFALAAYLPASVKFVAKQELAKIPVFGRAWSNCGHISIDRGDRTRAIRSIDRAVERARSEAIAVTMFPEGTRSPDGRLYSFKKGAFVLALKAGVPVVPVGISGSREIMPKGSFRVRGGEIRVRVGEPILVAQHADCDRNELLELSRRAVAGLIEGGDAEAGVEAPASETTTVDEQRGSRG